MLAVICVDCPPMSSLTDFLVQVAIEILTWPFIQRVVLVEQTLCHCFCSTMQTQMRKVYIPCIHQLFGHTDVLLHKILGMYGQTPLQIVYHWKSMSASHTAGMRSTRADLHC